MAAYRRDWWVIKQNERQFFFLFWREHGDVTFVGKSYTYLIMPK